MKQRIVEIESDLQALIPGFLKNRGKDLVELQSLINESKFEEIEKLAHRMKGSTGSYGFLEMSEVAARLENKAKDQNLNEIQQLIDLLKEILETTEVKFI